MEMFRISSVGLVKNHDNTHSLTLTTHTQMY